MVFATAFLRYIGDSLMHSLFIDIETFSSTNLAKSGVYRYCEADDFEVLLFGYSVDGGPVNVIDLSGGKELPQRLRDALLDDSITKWAFNASFERICLSRYLGFPKGEYLNPASWRCTMIWSAYLGLPLSLEGVGAVLGLEKQKLSIGKSLIRYFCNPCNPTISNDGRTRNLGSDAPDKWEQFIEYNTRDVEAEMAIHQRLAKFPVPETVWDEYHLDQKINDRGVLLDPELARQAIKMDELAKEEIVDRMRLLTEVENPNSVLQLKEWLSDNGLEMDSLGKKDVKAALVDTNSEMKEVLNLRLQLAKSSVRKYQAMENAVCSDGRARGMFQFYGANRTGRYSGRLIQVQNLPRNRIEDLEAARSLVKAGEYEALKILYDDVPDILSQLVRTAFIPKEGCTFIVSDFSAIEARVLSWIARERWREDVFADNGDIYCATASRMFHCVVEKHGENAHLRQKGKQAELACGYGGSTGALKAMGALESGMLEDELKSLVDAWRASNPNIVLFWRVAENAAISAVKDKIPVETHGLLFSYENGILFITLPSKRRLAYIKPRIEISRFGNEGLTYEGIGRAGKWERIETFGGKLVENCIQAISRDLLCYSMGKLEASGYHIVMHIHDEVIVEVKDAGALKAIENLMSEVPSWAEGLVLNAEGFGTGFYKKD